MKIQTIKKNNGFTLVETLFAILILTFVIVGMMTVVANSLFTARYARDEITANYLLQEVVDYVRNDRDTKVFLGAKTWDSFYSDYSSCSGQNGCYFNVLLSNPTQTDIKGCPSDKGCSLSFDDSVSDAPFYYVATSDADAVTKFKRKIIVTNLMQDEIIVTVTVSWKNGGVDRERTLTTSLMNWQK